MSVLHQKETLSKGKNSWILDTRVTDHVTYNIYHFITFYKIKPINIKPSNGSSVKAFHARTVQFSKEFMIFHVLYIPKFSFKIISIHRLIENLNCKLFFYSLRIAKSRIAVHLG